MNLESKESQFDRLANKYEKIIPRHIAVHYLNKRLAFIKAVIKEGLILDVGCGTGLLANSLEKLGFRVVGLEPSKGMIQEMKRMKRNAAVRGISESLPFKSDSFDLVLTIVTLHHIGDKEKIAQTLSEMLRVAKPASTILIWAHNSNNPYWPIFMKKLPWDQPVKRLIPLKEILEDLKREEVRRVEVYRKGFVPDFVPKVLLPLAKVLELILESMPMVQNFSAHNVIVVQKR